MMLTRRTLLSATAAAPLAAPAVIGAQPLERVRFVLNFRADGGTAGYILAGPRGHYREVGLEVVVEGSSGSGDAVTRVAAGNYEMGSADLTTLVEFYTRNPTTAPMFLGLLHDSSPQAVMSLAQANINRPQDLVGKRIGQGPADAASRLFPAFCRINNIDPASMRLQQVTPALRDQMLLTRQVDGVTGFDFTVFFNLKANGVDPNTIRSLRYSDFGMDLPGNGVLASRAFLAAKPDVARRLFAASTRCWHEVMADPQRAAAELKRLYPLLDEQIEAERIIFLRDRLMLTDRTRRDGLTYLTPERVAESIRTVQEGFGLSSVPTVEQIFDPRFLPSIEDRRLRTA